jgi:hypothetical protein
MSAMLARVDARRSAAMQEAGKVQAKIACLPPQQSFAAKGEALGLIKPGESIGYGPVGQELLDNSDPFRIAVRQLQQAEANQGAPQAQQQDGQADQQQQAQPQVDAAGRATADEEITSKLGLCQTYKSQESAILADVQSNPDVYSVNDRLAPLEAIYGIWDSTIAQITQLGNQFGIDVDDRLVGERPDKGAYNRAKQGMMPYNNSKADNNIADIAKQFAQQADPVAT